MSPADIELARLRARRRMIGMAVLVVIGVLGFPLLFETQPRSLSADVRLTSAAQNTSAAAPVSPKPSPSPVLSKGVIPSARPAMKEVVEELADEAPADKPASPSSALPAEASAPVGRVKAPVPAVVPKPRPDDKARADDKARQEAKAKAKAEPQAKLPSKDEAPTRYIVQVGAFADAAAAQVERLKVEKLGITTYTQAVDTPSGKKVRVRVGPFSSKADADKALDKLKKAGLGGNLLAL